MELLKTIREHNKRQTMPKPPTYKERERDIDLPKSIKVGQNVFNAFSVLTACLTAWSYGGKDAIKVIVGVIVIGVLATILEGLKNNGIAKLFKAYYAKQDAKTERERQKLMQEFDKSVWGLWPIVFSILLSVSGVFFLNKENNKGEDLNALNRTTFVQDSINALYQPKIDSINKLSNGGAVMDFVNKTYPNLFDDKSKIEEQLETQNGFSLAKQDRKLITDLNNRLEATKEAIESARKERISELKISKKELETKISQEISNSLPQYEDSETEDLIEKASYCVTIFIEFFIFLFGMIYYKKWHQYIVDEKRYYSEISQMKPYIMYDKDCTMVEWLALEFEQGDVIDWSKISAKWIEVYGKNAQFEDASRKLLSYGAIVESMEPSRTKGRGRKSSTLVYRLSNINKDVLEETIRNKYGSQINIPE